MDKVILESFSRVWPRHVATLTKFLIDCRAQFDGDIDLFLVLCVIGDRTFSARHAPPDVSYDQWSHGRVQDVTSIEINVQSISDFSGIPRETVRRKLNILVEKGWVQRDERGFVTATMKAKQDLEPLTLISLEYLSKMRAALLDP